MMLEFGDDGLLQKVNEENLIYVDKHDLDELIEQYTQLKEENEQLNQKNQELNEKICLLTRDMVKTKSYEQLEKENRELKSELADLYAMR